VKGARRAAGGGNSKAWERDSAVRRRTEGFTTGVDRGGESKKAKLCCLIVVPKEGEGGLGKRRRDAAQERQTCLFLTLEPKSRRSETEIGVRRGKRINPGKEHGGAVSEVTGEKNQAGKTSVVSS